MRGASLGRRNSICKGHEAGKSRLCWAQKKPGSAGASGPQVRGQRFKAEGAEAGSRDLPGVRQAGLEVWEGQLPPEGSVAKRQLTSPASHPSSGLADERAEG